MSLTASYIKHSKDKGREKGKGRFYKKQGRRWEVVGSLSRLCSRLWKRNPYRNGVSTRPADGSPRKDQGIWDSPVGHQPPFFYPAHPGFRQLSSHPTLQASIPSTATPSFPTYSATWPGANEPMKAQRAPSKERTVQELDALPPRCHLWDRHLESTRHIPAASADRSWGKQDQPWSPV